MKKYLFILAFICIPVLTAFGKRTDVSKTDDPLTVAKLIADRLIRVTPFKYKLVVAPNNKIFNNVQFVDFGRTFQLGKPAVAYAYTSLYVPEDIQMTFEIEHNDGCKVWLNSQLVYEQRGDRKVNLHFEERSIEMNNEFKVNLKKGTNYLLVKSETSGDDWRVYIQPPSTKGAVINDKDLEIGLGHIKNVDAKISQITNWLVIGPFANPLSNGKRVGLDEVYAPEKEISFGCLYQGLASKVTWTIPKIEILGDMINPFAWGTNYDWNYHNGGVCWAMEQLAEVTGEKKYDDYASRFCDFHLEGIPFVEYQLKTLNAFNCANHFIIHTPLLDFTTAPALPMIYKLRKNQSFPNRDKYATFVDSIINYARYKQIRLPGKSNFTRTTPEKYTTWTDDMFMGIPFLVQASQYTKDLATSRALLDDAASQILDFHSQVWDPDKNLYVHAHYSGSNVKLPYWSRANGWAIWAMTEVLMNLPHNHPAYKKILEYYRELVASLTKLQDKSGFWFNVLDRPDSQKEISGTAIFTMAIARGIDHGWIDARKYRPVAERGWEAIKTQIEPDGTVHKICVGTMCSEDVNYYMNRPLYDNDTHGLFAVLFAGIEMAKMEKIKK